MTTTDKDSIPQDLIDEVRFMAFIEGLATQAMVNMGKMVNPATGKQETDLDQAQAFIDLLGLLEKRTQGNLTEREKKAFELHLTNLRLNYLAERQAADKAQGGEAGSVRTPSSQDASEGASGESSGSAGTDKP